MIQDLRHAFRSLAKSPGFTATAIATLAVCLGANLAIFAVVDAILVRPLPFPEPDRIVSVFNGYPGAGIERVGASLCNYFDRRHSIEAFSSTSIYQDNSVIVGGESQPQRVPACRVSPEFFATLGVSPAIGCSFSDSQLTYDTDSVAILTDNFWRSHFDADPRVLGRTFINDGIKVTVIGVLPRSFRFLSSHAEFYRPISHALEARDPKYRHINNYNMIARLASGATLDNAQIQINAFNAHQATDDPQIEFAKTSRYHTTVRPLHEDHVNAVKPTIVLLQCGVFFLLLIGLINIANLLLIRASGRTKDIAIRQALGAQRRHIAVEVIVETTLLTLGGGILGLFIASLGIKLLRTLGSEQLPLGSSITLNPYLAALSLALAIIFGLILAVPMIWHNLQTKIAANLQSESRGGTTNRKTQRIRHVFIIAQIALAFVILSSASLLSLSLQRVIETPTGFNPDNVLTGQLSLPWKGFDTTASLLTFADRLLAEIRTLPGVTEAAIADSLPYTNGISNLSIKVEGYTPNPGESDRGHYMSYVSSDYWHLMNIPLVRGRVLEEADSHRSTRVCVVDQALADQYWPGSDPIGHNLSVSTTITDENKITVVGVVATIRQNEHDKNPNHGAIYFPNSGTDSFFLLVRSTLPAVSLAPAIRQAILRLNPGLPIDDLKPMQTRIDDSLITRRSSAILAGLFAGVALLLTAIGTYGVLAYAVSQRQREIGVRIALGAMPRQVLAQFIGLGAKLLAIGLALGGLGAWAAGHAMQSVLFGVATLHLGMLAATAGIILGVVFFAMFLPSLRAARVNPLDALRAE